MPLLRAGLMSSGVRSPYYAAIADTGNVADVSLDSSSNIYTLNSFFSNGYNKYNSSRGTFNSYRNIYLSTGSTSPSWTGLAVDSSQNTYLTGNAFVTSPSSQVKSILQINNSSGVTVATKEVLSPATGFPSCSSGKATIDSTNAIIGTFTTDDNTYSNDSGYVIKFTTAGAITWQRRLTDLSSFYNVTAQAVATDSSNNVYAVMTYNAGSYIAKWNSSGTIQWQRKIETNNCQLTAITVDSSANVYVAGKYTASSSVYGFVAKYNTSGAIQWQRSYVDSNAAGSQNTTFASVAVDSSANVYLVGKLKNTSGGFTMPVVKYDTSGTLQWQRNITDGSAAASQNTYGTSIKISGTSMIIGGAIKGDASYGTSFITTLPTDGTKTGTYVISSTGSPSASAIATMVYSSPSYTSATATQTDAAGTGTESVGLVTIQNLSTQTMTNNSANLTYPFKQVFI